MIAGGNLSRNDDPPVNTQRRKAKTRSRVPDKNTAVKEEVKHLTKYYPIPELQFQKFQEVDVSLAPHTQLVVPSTSRLDHRSMATSSQPNRHLHPRPPSSIISISSDSEEEVEILTMARVTNRVASSSAASEGRNTMASAKLRAAEVSQKLPKKAAKYILPLGKIGKRKPEARSPPVTDG